MLEQGDAAARSPQPYDDSERTLHAAAFSAAFMAYAARRYGVHCTPTISRTLQSQPLRLLRWEADSRSMLEHHWLDASTESAIRNMGRFGEEVGAALWSNATTAQFALQMAMNSAPGLNPIRLRAALMDPAADELIFISLAAWDLILQAEQLALSDDEKRQAVCSTFDLE